MLLERALFFFTIGAWVAALGFILILFVRTWQTDGLDPALHRVFSERMALVLLLFAVVVTFVSNALVFIEPSEVGVVVSLPSPGGYRPQPLGSGLHLIAPTLEKVYRYPIYWQTYTMSATQTEGAHRGDDSIAARTEDGQEIRLDISMIYAVAADKAIQVHIGWQDRYTEQLVRPLLRSVVRTYVSQFDADEINSAKRLDLERDLETALQTELSPMGFVVNRLLLRNIAFSPEYAQAVEQKQIQEQEIARAQHKADEMRQLAQGEADAARLRAQGESDALVMLGRALAQNPDVAQLRYIEKLAPNIQVMLLPSNAPFILPLPTLGARATLTTTATVTPTLSITPTATPTVTP